MKKTILTALSIFICANSIIAQQPDEIIDEIRNEVIFWINNAEYNNKDFENELKQIKEVNTKYDLDNHYLSTIQNGFDLYKSGNNAIKEKYNKDNIETILSDIKSVKKEIKEQKRQEELTEIHKRLYDYRYAVDMFKELIEGVEEQENENPGQEWEGVQEIIKSQAEDGYVKEIQKYAWLYGKYESYRNNLIKAYSDMYPAEKEEAKTICERISKEIKDIETE